MYDPVILTLPEHWASALVNADTTGLDDQDEKALDAFLEDHPHLYCVDVSEESTFCRRHDATAYGVLACQCSLFAFLSTEDEEIYA